MVLFKGSQFGIQIQLDFINKTARVLQKIFSPLEFSKQKGKNKRKQLFRITRLYFRIEASVATGTFLQFRTYDTEAKVMVEENIIIADETEIGEKEIVVQCFY